MKKIVIIGANSFQNRLILKAKEMGLQTHVFAWKEGAIGEKTADYFYPISIIEKEKILEECKKIRPDAVLTIASDLAVETVNYIAENLGLVSNKAHTSFQCTNKYEMREILQKAGVYTPKHEKVTKEGNINIEGFFMPVIVKPTDRSGSRGITLVEDKAKLEEAIKWAIENSFCKEAIVEEFIKGEEYSLEAISYKGKHYFLAMTKKFTTGSPNFIETGHMQPAGLDGDTQNRAFQEICTALDALGIEYGPSHSEFKIDDNGKVGIIEIGARMGGDCIGSDLVKISTGYDFLKMAIDVSLGNVPVFAIVSEPRIAIIKFIFNKVDLEKLEEFEKEYKEKIYYKSEIDEINHDVIDSSSRFGYYILQLKDIEEKSKIMED